MIEGFRTSTGELAFSFEGRLLCSKISPAKEAAAFIAKHVADIERSKTLFILGLGGGHVVEALHKKYPTKKIIVIEIEQSIIAAVSAGFAFSLTQIEIINANDISAVKKNGVVISGLSSSYCILRQPCVQWLQSEFYSLVYELLLGRAPDAFAFLLSSRDDVRDALRPLVEINGLASIKTLNQNLAQYSSGEKNNVRVLIKALRELVL